MERWIDGGPDAVRVGGHGLSIGRCILAKTYGRRVKRFPLHSAYSDGMAGIGPNGNYRCMFSSQRLPPVSTPHWPTVEALCSLGVPSSVQEISDAVISHAGLTEEQQAVLLGDGPKTEARYRVEWALSYLKNMGLAENTARGTWGLTHRGQVVRAEELAGLLAERQARKRAKKPPDDAIDDGGSASGEDRAEAPAVTWQDELRKTLPAMAPDAFERLTADILRAAGFTDTKVLGRSGDGGIDGVGTYRVSLISFPVYYQCKRYAGSVPSKEVRDFRGAMSGRGDRDLLITTGAFTTEAKREAARGGAGLIDLIDGEALCELLKNYELGAT